MPRQTPQQPEPEQAPVAQAPETPQTPPSDPPPADPPQVAPVIELGYDSTPRTVIARNEWERNCTLHLPGLDQKPVEVKFEDGKATIPAYLSPWFEDRDRFYFKI